MVLDAGDCVKVGCWVFTGGIVGLVLNSLCQSPQSAAPCPSRHYSLFTPDHSLSDLVFSVWYYNNSNKKNVRIKYSLVFILLSLQVRASKFYHFLAFHCRCNTRGFVLFNKKKRVFFFLSHKSGSWCSQNKPAALVRAGNATEFVLFQPKSSSEIWRGYPQEVTPWVRTLPSLPVWKLWDKSS